MFEEIKNRDAWSTLRGFVYQVDNTILRWLTLKDNEILELEKGEDIDIITHDFNNCEISRNLEQIKYREANITLNQNIALEILYNFFVHRQNNPDQKIFFRFISNTNYSTERPSLFIDGTSGIEAWIELHKAEYIQKDSEKYIIIKNHLIKKLDEQIGETKKENIKDLENQNKIKEFIQYINNDDHFIDFIKDFEWSLGNDDNEQISESIKLKIVNLNLIDEDKVDFLYSRLFFYIFKLLCKKGLKSINKKDLQVQASLYELNSSDQQTYEFINKLIINLSNKINDIEKNVSINSQQIATLFNEINSINNSDTVFDSKLKSISIKPPTLVKNGSLRKERVSEIVNLFKKHSWVNFQGINGSGKSQLASLVSIEFENYYWLDLRSINYSIEKSTLYIETFFSIISSCPIIHNRELWIMNIKNSLPENTIIVLNDLPILDYGSELSQLLVMFSNYLQKTNIKFLTTSNFKINDNIKLLFDDAVFFEYINLNFNKDEILECLLNNEASELVIDNIDLILTVSHGNPRLVTAIISHLKKLIWAKNPNNLFETLFKKEFSSDILQDSQLAIKNYIKDDKSKELLYRLSLIHWELRIENILAISKVSEPITYPNEKLQDLMYLWIQKQDDFYQVSPLVYDIGENNLPDDVKQNTHLAIAKSIISAKTINQLNASRSISSFIKGNDYNNAGIVLLKVYQYAKNAQEVNLLNRWGYLNYWLELDIPKEMSVSLRVNIRHEQLRLFNLINKEGSIIYNRLEEYVLEDSLTVSERIFIHLICLANFKGKDLSLYWEHVSFISTNWQQVDLFYKELIDKDIVFGFLWLPTQYLETQEDIYLWLGFIHKFESEFNSDFFRNHISEDALTIICNSISNSEISSWDEKIITLEYLHNYFKNKSLEVLSIIALKSIISIEFSIYNNQKKADELIENALLNIHLVESKFLLYENIGRLYFYENNFNKSKPWLLNAIETNCSSQANYIFTLISGAATITQDDSKKAVEFCKRAVELSKLRNDYDELDVIITLGELAIAFWIDGNFIECFEIFEIIVNKLLIIKNETNEKKWIRVFIICGHILGYLSSVIGSGRVPKLKDEIYTNPYQGILFHTTSDLTSLYKEENLPLLLALLSLFSYGINNISRAGYWALRAFDLARKTDDKGIFLIVSSVCSQYALINFNLEVTFEASLLFSAVSSHTENSFGESYFKYKNIKLWDWFTTKPSKEWDIAEDTTIGFTILPLFIITITKSPVDNDEGERFTLFIQMLKSYLPLSSNIVLWELVIELTNRIYNNKISIRELVERGNTFNSNDQRNLHNICSIGIIFLSRDSQQRFNQILNIFPYFSNKFSTFDAIIKYVFLPFLKKVCLEILNDVFVGNKAELTVVQSKIMSVSINDKNALQLVIQPLSNFLDIEMTENRRTWLFEFI